MQNMYAKIVLILPCLLALLAHVTVANNINSCASSYCADGNRPHTPSLQSILAHPDSAAVLLNATAERFKDTEFGNWTSSLLRHSTREGEGLPHVVEVRFVSRPSRRRVVFPRRSPPQYPCHSASRRNNLHVSRPSVQNGNGIVGVHGTSAGCSTAYSRTGDLGEAVPCSHGIAQEHRQCFEQECKLMLSCFCA